MFLVKTLIFNKINNISKNSNTTGTRKAAKCKQKNTAA